MGDEEDGDAKVDSYVSGLYGGAFYGDGEQTGVFSKSCHLRDNYAFFIYYLNSNGNSLKFIV